MKKIICIIMIVLMTVVGALCGCSPTEETSKSEVSSANSSVLPEYLGEADYSGKTLRILTTYEDIPFGKAQFGATETTSEPVNDACYERNCLLEENYGFKIDAVFTDGYGKYVDKVRTDITAGTVDYDICCTGIQALGAIAAEGFLLDLNAIENSHMRLDQEWWDVASNEDMTILGHLYFTTGDICIIDDENTRCVFYNKTILADNQLGNVTDLVYDGEWTLDVMYSMAKAAALECGDDGVMNVSGEDVWGLVCDSFDTYSLVLGCNCPQTVKNSDDVPELAMLNNANVNAFMKVYEIMSDTACTAYTEQYYRWNDPNAGTVRGQFYTGNALFFVSTINKVNSDEMREADISYGILPMPKYDVNQENYATTINPYSFMCVSIISECEDTDFVTFALEALAYSSSKLVTPEYYERTLKNKRFLDDDDSPEMLDIIFSNRIVDLSVVFDWDNCIQYYNQILSGGSAGLASYIEQHSSAFIDQLQDTLEVFEGR